MNATKIVSLVLMLLLTGGCRNGNTENHQDKHLTASGKSLLKKDILERIRPYSAPGKTPMQIEPIAVKHDDFDTAFSIRTHEKTENIWGYSLLVSNDNPIKKGDVVFASFYIRMTTDDTNSTQPTIHAAMSEPMPSYLQLATVSEMLTSEWKLVRFAFKSNYDYQKNGVELALQFGLEPKALEIGGLTFINYGSNVNIAGLELSPNAVVHEGIKKKITYAGREPNAKWRKEALERIEQIRKADISILVRDQNGRPLPDVNVQIKQKKHAFWFGTEIRALTILSDNDYLSQRNISLQDAQKYRDTAKELFNIAAFGQAMVWYYWDAHGKRTTVKVYDEWLKPNSIALRGIPLIWSGRQVWKNPEGLVDMPAEKLKERLRAHLIELMQAHEGNAVMWDVLNEPISEPDFINKLGRDEAVEWFKIAKSLAPQAKLYCNDYGLLTDHKKLKEFIELVQDLIDRGAPIDGVSPQSHLFSGQRDLPSIESIKQAFDMLAETSLEIYPDQFEVVVTDEQLQADFTRDFYILAFSHPAVVGLTHWGFWEGEIWMPDASWFRRDWSLKPAGKVFMDLVFDKWWTDFKGRTDQDGILSTQGFLGQYKVTVTANQQARHASFTLPTEGKSIVITLTQ